MNSAFLADLEPHSTALVVVDMQYFDAARDAGEGQTARDLGVASHFEDYFGQIDAITPRIERLLALFRRKRMEVIHLRVAEVTKDSRDVGYKQLVRGLVVPIDSREAEFLPGLEPAGDEIVVSKSSSGVFASTNLDRLLRNIGIRTLLFTGTSTSGCVQSAVYDALDLGYRVAVVADACADSTAESHRAAVDGLAGSAAAALTTEECLRAAEALPDADPVAKSGLERVKPYLPTAPYLPNDRPASEVGPYSLIFGPAVRLKPRRGATAVVVADAQHLACDPASSLGPLLAAWPGHEGFGARARGALEGIARLLAAARALGEPVIHIRTACHMADGRDLSAKLRRLGIRPVVGSAEAAFMPQALPQPGEAVLTKAASGIFTGTGLDEMLRNLGAETIVLAGISVDGMLEASLRSAGDRGYATLLVADACAGPDALMRGIRDFEKGIINVRTVAEAVEILEGAAP